MESLKHLLVGALYACSLPLRAQIAQPDFEDGPKACEQIKAKAVTEPQLTGPLSASQLPGCDSTALYYGFADQPDYAAALQCAWYERAHEPGYLDMFRGAGVLTMIYANGHGVKKDIDLAMRFSCSAQPDPARAELSGRLSHLDQRFMRRHYQWTKWWILRRR